MVLGTNSYQTCWTGHLVRLDALLGLVLTTKEGLFGDVIISGSVGCCNHEIVAFRILRGLRKANGRLQTLQEN